jgi:hypothetical protein
MTSIQVSPNGAIVTVFSCCQITDRFAEMTFEPRGAAAFANQFTFEFICLRKSSIFWPKSTRNIPASIVQTSA